MQKGCPNDIQLALACTLRKSHHESVKKKSRRVLVLSSLESCLWIHIVLFEYISQVRNQSSFLLLKKVNQMDFIFFIFIFIFGCIIKQ
jgi:hypothetical protein